MMSKQVFRAVLGLRGLPVALAGAVSLASCTHTPGTPGAALPSANPGVHRSHPGVQRSATPGRPAARTMRLSPLARRYAAFDDVVFEYRDRTLDSGDESTAARALSAFFTSPARCVNRVQRQLPDEGAVELSIRQNDPFSETQFVLRCRGACAGVLFRVETGFPSAFETQDGTIAGYPVIGIAPPRMAQNRDQGVVVWRAPGPAAGPATVDLLQVSRNQFAYGGGC